MTKINKGLFILFILLSGNLVAQKHTTTIGLGWANTSVNTVSFRKNALVTHKNMQYAAYYDVDSVLTLARRKTNEETWEVKRTPYKGNVLDAHNAISMMVDGDGFIHVAWNHHNNQLNYCTSVEPYSLELSKKKIMIGNNEKDVTYPEFHRLPVGDLIFLYRSGESGDGNLVMNRYNVIAKKWKRIQTNLIDGEKQRNAYWQTFVDANGVIHLSWVWRETWDVSTNHDMCYARSNDGGITWQNTTNEKYTLPIRADNAEYACRIPKGSELINQTSMYVEEGKIYIATYWRASGGIPQYFLVEHNGVSWSAHQVSNRTLDFSLSGIGTKKIPIARPEIVVRKKGKKEHEVILIYRDEERGSHVSIFVGNPEEENWVSRDLTMTSVGSWEPSYDTELWRTEEILDLFVQQTGQGDGEKVENIGPQPVTVLEWDGKKK
ncbi:MAG: BNR repeat-containing protein [Chryseolinea sp.]